MPGFGSLWSKNKNIVKCRKAGLILWSGVGGWLVNFFACPTIEDCWHTSNQEFRFCYLLFLAIVGLSFEILGWAFQGAGLISCKFSGFIRFFFFYDHHRSLYEKCFKPQGSKKMHCWINFLVGCYLSHLTALEVVTVIVPNKNRRVWL